MIQAFHSHSWLVLPSSPQHWGATWAHYQEQKGQLCPHTPAQGVTPLLFRKGKTEQKHVKGNDADPAPRDTRACGQGQHLRALLGGKSKRSRGNIIPSWLAQSHNTIYQPFQQSPRLFPKTYLYASSLFWGVKAVQWHSQLHTVRINAKELPQVYFTARAGMVLGNRLETATSPSAPNVCQIVLTSWKLYMEICKECK